MERGRGGRGDAYDDVADGFRCGGVRGRGGGGYGRGRGGAGDDVANGGRGHGGRRGRGHNGGGGRGYGRRWDQPQRSDRQYWRPSGEPPAPAPEHQADQNLDARPGRSDQSTWRPSGQPSPAPEQQAAQNRGGQGWRPAPEAAPSTSSPGKIDAVVSGVQGLQISKPTPVSPSLSSEEKLVPMKRPDKGGERSFKTVGLSVNHFNVSYDPERTIMHYDVAVKRVDATKTTKSGKIMKSDLAAIRKKLCTDKPAEFPLSWTAYDGDKNIFSAVKLPSGEFRVEIPEEEGTRLRTYMVSIKLVNELKLCKLREYVTCELLSTPRDVLHGMDLVMKEKPSRSLLSVGRGFYPAEFAREDNLGQGSAAFRGFQHSLKLTSQGPALCLDYSVMAFHKRMSVIDFLQEKIWGFSLREFWRFKGQVENVLKGLKVTVTHRRTKQKYVIKGLTDKIAAEITFDAVDVDGLLPPMSLRLVDYFREKYQDIKYKDIPCLDLGKNGRRNDTPLEFCVLAEGQRYPKEHLDRSAASKLKNMSLAAPRDRVSNILHMIKSEDGPCGGKIDENFGITVNKNMTKVIGRVLGPPELKLCAVGGKVTKVTVDREKCHWNLLGKSFVEGKSIARWAVIDFSSQDHRDRLDSNEFIPKLITRCNNLGMQMGEPCHFESCSMRPFRSVNLLREVLDKALKGGRGHLQLLVCAMSKKDPGYKYLKWICDTQIGIVTQCCLSRMASIASDQYLSNLALKINAKLGGSNVELIDRLPHFDGAGHVMFVGADVNHPAARNTTSPSIAAVVATINWPAVIRYAARVRSQHHRTESILNFGDMVLELVRSYYQINEVMPEKIVVFRDGVSEGQFDMVLNVELADLKRALGSINYYPTITVIVAQKRHSTRLFQENGPFNFSNVSPGTVVDTTIVHPFEFDFYLCSHYGSLGTSKPTHYYVLKDEHSFTSDQLQKLIYDLCYTFARCTKPVSLVPPVYYADLVAYRGRMYYEAMTEGFAPGSMISSSSASSSATFSVGSAEDRSYRLHPDLKDIMFFV